MTVAQEGEILTAIRFPKEWAGAKFYFEKVTDRNTWDFALVSVAAAMILEGNVIKKVRLACGAVGACRAGSRLRRMRLSGSPKDADIATTCWQDRGAGRYAAQLQPFQDSADGKPGAPRNPRSPSAITPGSRQY